MHTPQRDVSLGLTVLHQLEYLGVKMGNVSSDEAFAVPLREAQHTANVVASLQLSIRERIILLKTWVLPTVLLTSRADFPSDVTIQALCFTFQTTLGVNSWGVTFHELAQEPDLDGYQLPTPKVGLHAQFGLPFHEFTRAIFYTARKELGAILVAKSVQFPDV